MEACFRLCGRVNWPWGANQHAIFWNLGYHLSLRALDWLASISGTKIMAQKQKIGKNSTPTNASLGCIPPQAITHQPIELEGCSNPLKMGKSCSLQ